MAIRATRSERTVGRPALRVLPGGSVRRAEVVAEVLSDGTVRPAGRQAGEEWARFATGTVSGDGWTLWWERRYWDEA